MKPRKTILRLGTRGSRLARTQSLWVAQQLARRNPSLEVEVVICTTSGDRMRDGALHDFGGKGLFTKELEEWLLVERIDFAVHSYKDVPVTMPLIDQSRLCIATVPQREDPRDVLVTKEGLRIDELPFGAYVGTGSLRRQSQLLARRPDLNVTLIRGNVDTRLKKLDRGCLDAVVLALAGLKRCGLFDSRMMTIIDPSHMLPSAGQGALALQCRRKDAVTRQYLETLNDAAAARCVELERAIVSHLAGDCHSPIGALAEVVDGQVRLRAVVGAKGGRTPVIHAESFAPLESADDALAEVLATLDRAGAMEILHENRQHAVMSL